MRSHIQREAERQCEVPSDFVILHVRGEQSGTACDE